jgi:hypothetical protein
VTLAITSLSQLSHDLVVQLQAEFTQLLQEGYPEAELTRGVIHDVIAHLSGGVSGAVTRTEVQRVLNASSLLAISEDPTLADTEIVDAVLSNYRITRKPGAAATGFISVTVTDPTTVVVPAGAAYIANGVTFFVDDAFVIKPPGSQLLSPNDKLLESKGGNTYAYTVPATASTTGAAGNIRRGTKMVPTPIPARFVTAFAATDFSGGSDTELNDELLQRMELGVAAQVMQGRKNIIALLKAQPAFADTQHYAIAGFGNPEMTRDQHSIFPVSGGGRVDIYARTTLLPITTQITKTAVLVDVVNNQGVWQFSLTRSESPGCYDIVQILLPSDPPDAAGFSLTVDTRGFDLTDAVEPVPDIVNASEAAYSAYQTGVFRFVDTETAVASLTVGTSTASYIVAVRGMPLIEEIQEFCRDADTRNLAGDVLVKAPIPCFLTVNFDIEQAAGETTPDLDVIRNAVAAAVNGLEFPGRINASFISDVVYNYLSNKQVVGPIEMLGKIRRPDGTYVVIRDRQVLQLPDTPLAGVTGRITAVLLDPVDVGVRVVTKGFNEIG